MSLNNLTMAVIFGSRSCEHDVSIISALQWMDAADKASYHVVPLYIARDGLWYTGDKLRQIEAFRTFDPQTEGIVRVQLDTSANAGDLWAWPPRHAGGLFGRKEPKPLCHIDVAVPVLHGLNGEDGTVQGMLELANIPYTSAGLLGSSVGMDKIAMKMLFRGAGFPVVDGDWFTRDLWHEKRAEILERLEARLSYPLFVKPANLGSSIGITRATDLASLAEAIDVAASFDRRILVEAGVEHPVEVNCAALGYGADVQVSVCEMPISSGDMLDFAKKYLANASKSGGSKGMQSLSRVIPAPVPADMTQRIQDLSRDIFRVLDCKGTVRIDFMIDAKTDALYVGEVNTIPGSLAFYLWDACGVHYPELVEKMVEYAFKAHADKNHNVVAYDSTILQGYVNGAKGAKKA